MRRSPLRSLLARVRDPVIILPYLGYGTPGRLAVCGRVLQDEGFPPARDTDRALRNLVAFFKRLESDEVPGALLRLAAGRHCVEVASDREGYFSAALERAKAKPGWNTVPVELVRDPAIRASAEVLVPSPQARFGVISDIDDTIVQSNVIRKTRMLLTVALGNARTRKPFEGAAAFYRALHAGVNPIFYVSKSPWNLYVPLLEYMQVQGFPRGPLLLRDFGLRTDKNHKCRRIEEIVRTYPRLPFVLIGDSGERDPEIYAQVVRRHPQRVRAIYIRSVDPDPARIAAIGRLAREISRTGCQLVLAPDSAAAAAHAAGEGLVPASALRAVAYEARSERSYEARSRAAGASRASKPAASTGGLK